MKLLDTHLSLWPLISLAFSLLLPRLSLSHEIRHTVSETQTVVVTLFFSDQTPFSFVRYEVYRQGEERPFQTGETDRQGRLAFLPDGKGEWVVKAFSTDGHGVELRLSSDEASGLETVARPLVERYPLIFAGVGVIFGLFGLAALFFSHRR